MRMSDKSFNLSQMAFASLLDHKNSAAHHQSTILDKQKTFLSRMMNTNLRLASQAFNQLKAFHAKKNKIIHSTILKIQDIDYRLLSAAFQILLQNHRELDTRTQLHTKVISSAILKWKDSTHTLYASAFQRLKKFKDLYQSRLTTVLRRLTSTNVRLCTTGLNSLKNNSMKIKNQKTNYVLKSNNAIKKLVKNNKELVFAAFGVLLRNCG
jgi:hypothetical protein